MDAARQGVRQEWRNGVDLADEGEGAAPPEGGHAHGVRQVALLVVLAVVGMAAWARVRGAGKDHPLQEEGSSGRKRLHEPLCSAR